MGSPSTRTVQLPHSASLQPIFVPVSCNRFLSKSARVSPGSAAKVTSLPLTVKVKFFPSAILTNPFLPFSRQSRDIPLINYQPNEYDIPQWRAGRWYENGPASAWPPWQLQWSPD